MNDGVTRFNGILKFNEVVRSFHRITDNEVATEVAKQVVLERNPVATINVGMVRAEKRRQVQGIAEEGQNLFALRQCAVLRDQGTIELKFLPALLGIPVVLDE